MITVSEHSVQALELLIELGLREPDFVPVGDAITSRGLSDSAMTAVLPRLRRAGLLRSKRGISGGYQLGRPATDITVADIVQAVDGLDPQALEDGVLRQAAQAITNTLAQATVADCIASEASPGPPSPMYYI